MTFQTKLLKILFIIYGICVCLFFATFVISLYVHEDLLLVKAPRHFEWIAGDLVAILGMPWGILVALSTVIKRVAGQMLAILSLLLALSINIIVGWISWKIGSFLGVPMAIFLFLLPSLLLIGTRNARTPSAGGSPS